MHIEIAYANETEQTLLTLEISRGTTVEKAIYDSGILNQHPDIDLTTNTLGIFSKKTTLDTVLNPGDRIEIYRPLKIDPKQKRLLKAKRKKSTKQ